jgi:alpha-1,2-mannosyltransferase
LILASQQVASAAESPRGVAVLQSRWTWLGIGAVVGLFAFAIRLVPVLNGGGLRGFYNYDPAVYYAAAAGMANGLMPYRDFLLLHPPGVPLILLPFALIGRFSSDALGMEAARLAMMAMGSVTAVLITRILRQAGAIPALLGGLAYAVYWPAVYSERSTWLEGPGSFLTAVALWLLLAPPVWLKSHPRWTNGLAGAALTFACLTKMWLAVPLATVVLWIVLRRRWRDLGWFAVGGTLGGVLPLLPFIPAFPQLWNMVVTTQFGRQRGASDTLAMRLEGLSGLNHVWSGHLTLAALAAVVGLCGVAVLALTSSNGRMALLLTTTTALLLLTTPAWFRHYPALIAVPLMVCLGEGAAPVLKWLRLRWLQATASVLAAGILVFAGATLLGESVGTKFNGPQLARVTADYPGCVTTDDPNALIAADLIKSNLAQGCHFVIDLSGYRYYLGDRSTFVKNQAWQEFASSYLSDGSLNILLRGTTKHRLNPAFYEELRSWPVAAIVSGRKVRAQP